MGEVLAAAFFLLAGGITQTETVNDQVGKWSRSSWEIGMEGVEQARWFDVEKSKRHTLTAIRP